MHEKTPLEQEKPRLWTLNFVLICLTALSLCFVFHSFNSTLPIYIERFGGSTKIAGLALTALTVTAIIVRPLTGFFLDKYGRKIIFLTGVVLFLIPTLIYTAMIPVYLLIIFRFVQGLGWGIGHTASGTVALDIVPKKRLGEGLGFYNLANSVSNAFSPAIALWIINSYSFRALFLVCSLVTIITLLLALLLRYPRIERQLHDFKFEIIEKTALRPSIIIFIAVLTNSSLTSFLPLYALEKGLTTAGLFFTAMAVSTLISRFLSNLLIDRAGEKGYDLNVIIGSAAIVTAMLIIAQTSSLLHLLAGGLAYGIGLGFFQFSMLILSVQNVAPEKKGTANATYWTSVDAGIAAGSFFWGFVAAALGYKKMYTLAIIPVMLAFTLYFIWKYLAKQQKRNTLQREFTNDQMR
ncbi:MAG: MFS transporter [Firmicutes bacterium]|nr:MFS transporter [Bacillota bacterium]